MDAQSVENTDTAEEKSYDAGKKVSGIKRHIAVDINDLPHAIFVTTANISDKAGILQMLDKAQEQLSFVVAVLCDGGYIGQPFADAVKKLIDAEVQIVKRNVLHMGPREPSSTVLSKDEKALIVAFRKHTLLPLDDCRLYALQAHPS